jgi:osmoprotectant transport system permease protein
MAIQKTVWQYIQQQWPHIEPLVWQQIELVAITVVLATVIGVGVGCLVFRSERGSALVIAVTSSIFQLPSLALVALLLAIGTGLGETTALISLLIYAPLPILRNAIVGLQGVDAGVVESARGLGMGSFRSLITIQLPLAWPVILAGLRVATMTISGISAISAYAANYGLGVLVFDGLSRAGAVNATNQALVGTGGIALIALLFDAGYVGVRRFTVSGGIRV